MKENKLFHWIDRKRKGLLAPCAFLLGLISAVVQVALIRVLMTAFGGNELVFVIVLAVWLTGVALGAFVMRGRDLAWAAGLFIVASVLVPLTLLGAKLLRPALGIPAGSAAGIGAVAFGTVILLLPLAMALGAIFRILAATTEDGSCVYGHEALGFVAGGLLTTIMLVMPLPQGVAAWAQQKAWPGYRMVASEQTRYGELVVAGRAGQKSFFGNGRHLFTTQDDLSAGEVHLALLSHPAPASVFLMGGGFSEAGQRALEHPLARLDYAELDPALIALERRETAMPQDARFSILPGDPRSTLARSRQMYDVILLNAGDPTDLAAGRFFTREFFALARGHLAPGGLLAVSISSSENYVNAQGRAYARSVAATLGSVFKDVQVIPGERMTFIASDAQRTLSADILTQRLKERGITALFLEDGRISDRMEPLRMAAARALLREPGDISTDDRPVVSLRALVHATTRLGYGFARLMQALERWGWVLWLVFPAGLAALAFRRNNLVPTGGAVVAGFTQMVFQVAAIFMVQSVFGYAYAAIGLLTAGFMLGVFGGTRPFLRVRADVAAGLQAVLALFFIGMMWWWPAGIFIFPVLAGVAGGMQFTAYCVMAGEGRSGKIYAADVVGAALGVVCAGLVLVPLWGMFAAMMFIVLINAVMGVLLRYYPASVSAER